MLDPNSKCENCKYLNSVMVTALVCCGNEKSDHYFHIVYELHVCDSWTSWTDEG